MLPEQMSLVPHPALVTSCEVMLPCLSPKVVTLSERLVAGLGPCMLVVLSLMACMQQADGLEFGSTVNVFKRPSQVQGILCPQTWQHNTVLML